MMYGQIGNRFAIPLEGDTDYQFVSDEDWAKMKGGTWTPTVWGPLHWSGTRAERTEEGWIRVNGLLLVERSKQATALSAEDERVKPLVIEAISRRALGGTGAVFDGGTVRRAFAEVKAAYDDIPFRNANRGAIVERAKRLARRAGQTPEMVVSTEAPVPCWLEGMQLYFFNEQRLLPIWRLFEPLAIVQVREDIEGRPVPPHGSGP